MDDFFFYQIRPGTLAEERARSVVEARAKVYDKRTEYLERVFQTTEIIINEMSYQGDYIHAIKDMGLEIKGTKPCKAWRGFIIPDKRIKDGKAIAAELAELVVPGVQPILKFLNCDIRRMVTRDRGFSILESKFIYIGPQYFIMAPVTDALIISPPMDLKRVERWEIQKAESDWEKASLKSEKVPS